MVVGAEAAVVISSISFLVDVVGAEKKVLEISLLLISMIVPSMVL